MRVFVRAAMCFCTNAPLCRSVPPLTTGVVCCVHGICRSCHTAQALVQFHLLKLIKLHNFSASLSIPRIIIEIATFARVSNKRNHYIYLHSGNVVGALLCQWVEGKRMSNTKSDNENNDADGGGHGGSSSNLTTNNVGNKKGWQKSIYIARHVHSLSVVQ